MRTTAFARLAGVAAIAVMVMGGCGDNGVSGGGGGDIVGTWVHNSIGLQYYGSVYKRNGDLIPILYTCGNWYNLEEHLHLEYKWSTNGNRLTSSGHVDGSYSIYNVTGNTLTITAYTAEGTQWSDPVTLTKRNDINYTLISLNEFNTITCP
jgi:hypothetical protein